MADQALMNRIRAVGGTRAVEEWNAAGTRINLEGADLRDADFTGANMNHAQCDGATITDARFVNANLASASFREAVLCGSTFLGAHIRETDFTGANLGRVMVSGMVGIVHARFTKAILTPKAQAVILAVTAEHMIDAT